MDCIVPGVTKSRTRLSELHFHSHRGWKTQVKVSAGWAPFAGGEGESVCNAGDLRSIPGFGRSPGEGNGYPLQHSGLENSMDCIVHGGSKESDTTEQLSLSL